MLEIVYPEKRAPLAKGAKTSRAAEMLPIVDTNGVVVEQAPRSYCHGARKPLHPVVHLHIIDRRGRLYLQKRAMDKDLLPGYWDTAVGGHVSYGEYISEALVREAGEELGLFDFNPILLDSYIYESNREKELVFTFAVVGNYELHPDNSEVSEGRYWTFQEITESLGKSVLTPNFESEFNRFKDALMALL